MTDNLEKVTEAIKPVLGDSYCYDSTVSPSRGPFSFPSPPTFHEIR